MPGGTSSGVALTLTYQASDSTVVGVLTGRLALVQGAFGQALIDPVPASKTWQRVGKSAVIPYAGGWATAAAWAPSGQVVVAKSGGATQTNLLADAAGYYGWQVQQGGWGAGTFNLTLSFPGTATNTWTATLVRLADSTVLLFQ